MLAVLSALLMFRLLPRGFSNRELRDHLAQLLACPSGEFTPGRMSYQLRRLRLKGLIQRLPRTNRYEVTDAGLRAALFYTGSLSQIIRPLTTTLDQHDDLQQRLLKHLQQFLQQLAT